MIAPLPSFYSNQEIPDASDLEIQMSIEGNTANTPLFRPPVNTPFINTLRLPLDSSSTEDQPMLDEFTQDPLPRRTEARTMLDFRPLKSKLNKFPANGVENTEHKGATRKAPRKGGRQHGLNAEQKEGAALMRREGACVLCAIDKAKVRWKKIAYSKPV
jgi:hypothetical protein